MDEASKQGHIPSDEPFPHACGGCGALLNDATRALCGICNAKICTYCGERGHTREEHFDMVKTGDSEDADVVAARFILLDGLGLPDDSPVRMSVLAARLRAKYDRAQVLADLAKRLTTMAESQQESMREFAVALARSFPPKPRTDNDSQESDP